MLSNPHPRQKAVAQKAWNHRFGRTAGKYFGGVVISIGDLSLRTPQVTINAVLASKAAGYFEDDEEGCAACFI